jgi:hypothetical protein
MLYFRSFKEKGDGSQHVSSSPVVVIAYLTRMNSACAEAELSLRTSGSPKTRKRLIYVIMIT